MPRRILITTSSFDVGNCKALTVLQSQDFEMVTNSLGRRLTEAEVSRLLGPEVVGMIAGVEPLTRNVLEQASGLRVISRCGVGMDSVDVAAAAEHGILVCNTPDAPARAVAELTLGLMLSLLRHVCLADRNVRTGNWKPLMGGLLSEQTVGIIGCGNIGRTVAGLVAACGAQVVAYDPLGARGCANVTALELDSVLARADIVTLHLPYTEQNHYLFNAQRFGAMKQGALIINVARGGLIDESALYQALVSGHLAAAALDCFEEEPYRGPLVQLENVILTAHMGSYAKEARALMEREAADNLLRQLIEQGLARQS